MNPFSHAPSLRLSLISGLLCNGLKSVVTTCTEPTALHGRRPNQPFFTTKPTGEGTGLGLSLSYDIITKGHGGALKVNSIEGNETEFIITIPV